MTALQLDQSRNTESRYKVSVWISLCILLGCLNMASFSSGGVAVFLLYASIEGSMELDVVPHQPHQQRWTV